LFSLVVFGFAPHLADLIIGTLRTKVIFSVTLLVWSSLLLAQTDTLQNPLDTLSRIGVAVDSTGQDTSQVVSLGVPISADSLDAAVAYSADGYMEIDAVNEKIHLYDNALVTYESITLRAAHIELSWAEGIVVAEGIRNDTTGVLEGLPEFTEGQSTFVAERMRYNFETRKGIVYDVVTTENDVQVRGAKSKFISAPPGDTTAHDIIYSQDAIFTTCTADHPHFGIRSSKQKVVAEKQVIVGPSRLEIMGVPTPLWLPFGFFPLSSGRSTGLIFPRNYEYSPQFGFGLQQVGWYFPLGDNLNLTVAGDYYLQGTWGIRTEVDYRKRYRYNGGFSFRYDSRNQEQVFPVLDENGNPVIGANGQPSREPRFVRQNGISIRLNHSQDAAAHPMNRLSGSINFQTNNFQSRVQNDFQSVTQNTINSNFSFSRNWQDKPMSMSVAFRHSQNTRTREMNVDFPTFQFQTQALYPFRRKERIGPKRWYEDITMRYTNEARANFTASDTTFFEPTTLENARYGMQHNVTAGTSFKILKFFNLNPGVNYREVWNMSQLNASFVADPVLDTVPEVGGGFRVDTLDFGTYQLDTLPGFASFRTYGANLSLTTQVFGTFLFNKGPVRGLRHVIKPTVSVGYAPDYRNNSNYYIYLPDTLAFNDPTRDRTFSRFQNSIFGGPPSSETQFALNYSLTNIFEAKLFSRKDSTTRNIKLFDNIYVNGNYNFAADTLKWSPISASGTTRLFKGATTFSFSATFDPHVREQTSPGSSVFRRVNRTTWQEGGKPFEFVDATFRFNTNLTVRKIRAIFQGKEEELVERVDTEGNDLRPVEETDFLSLFENFSLRHNLVMGVRPLDMDRDTFTVNTHSLELRGSIALTPNWNVDIGSIGYDFARKQTTYPFLGLRRDLHCWELGFNWAPTRNTYAFYLRVKPGTLDFIKVPYQRNNYDGQRPFR
jgi:hypothetical protein